MRQITKQQYIQGITNLEKIYLIVTDEDTVYLKADIERGGEIRLRVEMMDFDLDTSLTFWEASGECRERYAGGIYFIEYETYEEAKAQVLDDFLGLSPDAIYLHCEENDLKCVVKKYKNHSIYVLT